MSIEDTKPLHALLSPSGADRWMICTGSVALGMNEPGSTSEYADEGTAAHWLAAWCLKNSDDPVRYLDRKIEVINGVVWEGGDTPKPKHLKGRDYDIEREFEVDSEMVMHVRRYVNNLRKYANGNTLYVEQQLPIGHITGEEGATGTGDGVVLTADGVEIQAHDLKFGRGVEVKAERNRQLMLYGLGALHKYGEEIEAEHGALPTRFRAVIHQPRINDAPDEWDCSVEELLTFADDVRSTAKTVMGVYNEHVAGRTSPVDEWTVLIPGETQCRFCNAKPICPKLARFVEESVGADFEDLSTMANAPDKDQVEMVSGMIGPGPDLAALGVKARAYDLIEMWGKAVRAKIEHVLLESRNAPVTMKALGYKLVQGKKGNRQWKDETVVEQLLKKMRFRTEQIYDMKVKSPPKLEKELKEQPKRWTKLKELIAPQSPGQPHVAPLGDKREPMRMADASEDFTDMSDAIVTQPGESIIATVNAARSEDDGADLV